MPYNLHAALLTALDNSFGAALKGFEVDEISACGLCPLTDTQIAEFLVEDPLDHLELGAKDVRMLLHMYHQAVNVAKIAHMAELVDLVMSDGLDGELFADILEVVRRGCKGRDAAAGEMEP